MQLVSITMFTLFLKGMGTSAERSSCNTDYYKRGDVLPGIRVDGMDVLAVKNATEFAIKYVNENRPLVIEVLTYRLVLIDLLRCSEISRN